eukprot:gnl/TRDRNA2_/TRDRNA2_33214_c0_seq1.p1 gnl/TRDRNA2_/TRDRNA2_33214_c0~~gnl/TRDRNA2_/TRDRNA2_33214_c0_seq1.p1  ORF type:complete len:151 (-),score=13.53 gnl/TRDRNA2_/TRDRNA2_33214_c0_seq1:160-612(-)
MAVFGQLVNDLGHMHNSSAVYWDVQFSSIFMKDETRPGPPTVALGDFHMALPVDFFRTHAEDIVSGKHPTLCEAKPYGRCKLLYGNEVGSPPELSCEKCLYSVDDLRKYDPKKADVFALGKVLCKLMGKIPPESAMPELSAYAKSMGCAD